MKGVDLDYGIFVLMGEENLEARWGADCQTKTRSWSFWNDFQTRSDEGAVAGYGNRTVKISHCYCLGLSK